MSKFIPQALLYSIPDLYETEGKSDPVCHIKLFLPTTHWSWYVIELSKENLDICYGYVEGLENELGYFSLKELESLQGFLGFGVERDEAFKPSLLSKIKS
jgi:hypothetical protein